MKRALVVNIARMGDLIHSTPLMQGLREDSWEVTLLYSDGFSSIAPLLGGPHHLIPIRLAEIVTPLLVPHGPLAASYSELRDLIDRLRNPRFDLAINITHTRYSGGLMKLIDARKTIGLTLDGRGSRKVHGDWANYYFNSILNRSYNPFNLVDLHRMIGGVHRSYPVKLNLADANPSSKQPLDSQLSTLNSNIYVGLVPGASTPEKRWPVEFFAEAVKIARRSVDFTPVILGGPDEQPLTDRLASLLPDAIDLGGKTGIPTLAGEIAKLTLLVSNDTGPIHIAAAVGTKVLDITLGSAKGAESAPYGSGHFVVEPNIGCFPCQPSMRCSHLSCHRYITPDVVASLIVASLQKQEAFVADPNLPSTALLYRTGFDADRFFELQPLTHRPVTLSDIVIAALRQIWKSTLSSEPFKKDRFDAAIAEQAQIMLQRFAPPANPFNLTPLTSELTKLEAFARRGADLAHQIERIATDPRRIDEVKTLESALNSIDEQISRLAYGRTELMPLVAQFSYSKKNSTATDLLGIARELSILYSHLAERSSSLSRAISTICHAFMK